MVEHYFGDMFGRHRPTCYEPMGSSVVDYAIDGETLYKDVTFFKIYPFKPDLSDHYLIYEY